MIETLKKIKVLFIEDNPDDVELELYELRKGGFDVNHTVARNREQFLASLENLDADNNSLYSKKVQEESAPPDRIK